MADVRRDGRRAPRRRPQHPAAPAVPRSSGAAALGRLIEFPAVVDDGVAYIGNASATVHAISMRSGNVRLGAQHAGAPRMASSPAVVGDEIVYHTMDGRVYVLDRANGRLRVELGRRLADRVVADRRRRHRLLRRLERADVRARPAHAPAAVDALLGAKITSSAAIAGGRLFIGDYDGRLWALSPRTGATRWVGSRERPRSTGRRRLRAAASSSRRRPADSLTAFSTSGR